jgi:hypothetical protein
LAFVALGLTLAAPVTRAEASRVVAAIYAIVRREAK